MGKYSKCVYDEFLMRMIYSVKTWRDELMEKNTKKGPVYILCVCVCVYNMERIGRGRFFV